MGVLKEDIYRAMKIPRGFNLVKEARGSSLRKRWGINELGL